MKGTRPNVNGIPPPHNTEAEKCVLGAVLIAPSCLPKLLVEEGLRAEHFYRDSHRTIFAAMSAMNDAGRGVDIVTLTAWLHNRGTLDEIGGRASLDELCGGVPGLGNVREYARIVIAAWRWHERLIAAYELQAAVIAFDEARFEAAVARAIASRAVAGRARLADVA
jgi:replicative DNA helicase